MRRCLVASMASGSDWSNHQFRGGQAGRQGGPWCVIPWPWPMHIEACHSRRSTGGWLAGLAGLHVITWSGMETHESMRLAQPADTLT